MGKKFSLLAAVLALAGAAVAGLLVYSYYYPRVSEQFILCGGGVFAGNCDSLYQWKYATIFRMPLASYGLFIYAVIAAVGLIAACAGGVYARYGFVAILPLAILSLAADAALAAVMALFKTVCMLCITTYAINLLIFIVAWLWYRRVKREEAFSFREILAALLPRQADTAEKKAITAICLLFTLLLLFSVFAASQYMQMRVTAQRESQERAKQFVENFFRQPPEDLALPESSLVFGDRRAPVKMVVFTDFLCTACQKFFQVEKALEAKYRGKISVTYYNYPLDKECNSFIGQTAYPQACVAAKAVLAAARLNILPEYADRHYARYKDVHAGYTAEKAAEAAAGLADPARFRQELESDAVRQLLRRDVELGGRHNLEFTPTIFINGRKISGAPPVDILETIIEKEIKRVSG